MWTVVGLGNPGPEYARTRHNLGFMVAEQLAHRWCAVFQIDPDRSARRARACFAGRCTELVQPQTFMNRSGSVLSPSVDPWEVIAVYDDLDLIEGQLRIRSRGGTGGHRGVASLVERLGDGFVRLRIGIGRPPKGVAPAAYVLEPLTGAAEASLTAACGRACEAVEVIIGEGTAVAMSRFNSIATVEQSVPAV